MALTVIGSFVSPYVRKVLACIELKGLDYEVDPITPFFGNDEFTRLSPLRRIPVLIDGDFHCSDSTVICAYLDEAYDGYRLLPESAKDRARARWLEEFADSRLGDIFIWSLFYQRVVRRLVWGEEPDQDRVEKAVGEEAPAALDYLEAELPKEGYLFGELGLADIAIASFFVNAGYAGFEVDGKRWPRVARFVGDVLAEPPLQKLLGFEAIQMSASIQGRRQALEEAGARLTARTWGVREPRRGDMGLQAIKQAAFRELDPAARAKGLSVTNRIVIALILASVATAMLETEPLVSAGREALFRALDLGFGILFLVEYLARLWVADLSPDCRESRWPRLKFVTSPSAIIDLIAIIPAMLAMAAGGTLALRFVRFFRLLRLAKLGRFSRAWKDLSAAIAERREELFIAVSLAAFVMLIASTLLYLAEGDAQPDKFGSIPRAMWWAIVTLTTVGYGDVFPVTVLGRIFSGLVLVAAVGLIALPTGIFAGAMTDVIQRRRRSAKGE